MRFFILLLLLIQTALAQTTFQNPTLIIGKNTDVDMTYKVDRAGSNYPGLLWDASEEAWYYSNDGLTYDEMVSKAYVDAADTDIDERLDDLEAKPTIETYPDVSSFPGTGVDGVLYLAEDTNALYRWDSVATDYVKVGGGGISNWQASFNYIEDDVVIESDKIYQANTTHTSSGSFATDIANWDILFPDRVVGPASSTDNAISRFDGTTGKLIQNSVATVADDGQITAKGITATNAADTSSFHGIQINNSRMTAVSGTNLELDTVNGNVRVKDNLVPEKLVLNSTSVDSTSGSNVTLATPTATYVNLTAPATLFSIDMIPAGLANQELILFNATGLNVLINHNTGSTAANRIYTGGTTFNLMDKTSISLFYDSSVSRWIIKNAAAVTALVNNNSEPVSFDPTSLLSAGFGSVTNAWGEYTRRGDRAFFSIGFRCGTVANAASLMILPSGLNWQSLNVEQPLGQWLVRSTTQGNEGRMLISSLTDRVYFGNPTSMSTGGASPLNSAVGNAVFSNSNDVFATFEIPIRGWSATNPNLLIAPDTFSTDYTPLTFKTSAVTSSDPVGTFSTEYYASTSSNARTQCTSAPSQSTSDMASNGVRIFTRAYNAASTCGSPARIQIQVGKNLKGISIGAFSGTPKDNAVEIDSFMRDSAFQAGLAANNYDEKLGILTLDAGYAFLTSNTAMRFMSPTTGTDYTSAYLVINASKNPALTGFDMGEILVRAIQTSGQSITNSGAGVDLVWDTAKTYDTTNGWFVPSTGVFTNYGQTARFLVCARIRSNSLAWTNGTELGLILVKNSSNYSLMAVNFIQASATLEVGVNGCDVVSLAQGETLKLQAENNRGAGAVALGTTGILNFISISKLK